MPEFSGTSGCRRCDTDHDLSHFESEILRALRLVGFVKTGEDDTASAFDLNKLLKQLVKNEKVEKGSGPLARDLSPGFAATLVGRRALDRHAARRHPQSRWS
jgi:hypothetical protein